MLAEQQFSEACRKATGTMAWHVRVGVTKVLDEIGTHAISAYPWLKVVTCHEKRLYAHVQELEAVRGSHRSHRNSKSVETTLCNLEESLRCWGIEFASLGNPGTRRNKSEKSVSGPALDHPSRHARHGSRRYP